MGIQGLWGHLLLLHDLAIVGEGTPCTAMVQIPKLEFGIGVCFCCFGWLVLIVF